MDKMPYKIKQKLRQYANIQTKASNIAREIDEMMEEYNIPVENLTALADIFSDEPRTEALAFLHNAECDDVESVIAEIEKVFLYFANKNNDIWLWVLNEGELFVKKK